MSLAGRCLGGVLLAICAGLLGAASAAAAPGDLDLGFGVGGVITTQVGRDDYGGDVTVDAAGRTVIVGHSETFSVDQSSIAVARYTKQGMPDLSFGGDGLVTLNLGSQTIDFGQAVAVDTNGRIVLVGASCPSTSECFDVLGIRLTASGQVDLSFGGGDGIAPLADAVSEVIIDPGGRIVVTGSHEGDLAVFRLTPDGAIDTSFSGDGIATAHFSDYDYSYGYSLALDSQGRIVVAGEAAGEDEADFAAARFLGAGALDPSFSGDGRVATDLNALGNLDYTRSLALDSSDRTYLFGTSFPADHIGPWHTALVRYTAAGALDGTFGTGGVTFGDDYESATAIAIDASQRLLLASGSGEDLLRRYLPTGDLDPSFGGGDGTATVPLGIQEGMTIDPWRRIAIVGSNWNGSESDLATTRFLSGDPMPSSPALTVSVAGSGSVTGPGIECPSDCAETLAGGAPISLLAAPAPGSTFAGWSGACTGTGPCELALGADTAVAATFNTPPSGDGPAPGAAAPPPPPAAQQAKPKVLKCRKGFKKRKVRGKRKCVKAKKAPRARRRHGSEGARRGGRRP